MNLFDDLKRQGFAHVPHAISDGDLATLRAAATEFFALPARPWSAQRAHRDAKGYELACFSDDNWSVVVDFVGLRPAIDQAIERLLTNPILQSMMTATLGEGYKLWQVTLRRAEPGGPGMRLHQDAVGEFGLSVLLTDAPTRDGATAFLPGTHRWPINITDVAMGINPALARVCAHAGGSAGDAWAFINRTWHGRFANQTPEPAISLMFGFFAQGASYPIHHTPREKLDALGPELRRLLDPDVGVQHLEGGRAKVDRAASHEPRRDPDLRPVMEDQVTYSTPWKAVKALADGQRAVRRRLRSALGR